MADPGCLSRIPLFSIPDPGSELCISIPDPGSSKNLSILTPKKAKKWFLSSKKYDPGCSFRIPDPDADFFPSRIPDPGVKKAPNPGSATLPLRILTHLDLLGFGLLLVCLLQLPLPGQRHVSRALVLQHLALSLVPAVQIFDNCYVTPAIYRDYPRPPSLYEDFKEGGEGSLYSCTLYSVATVMSCIDASVRKVTNSPKVRPLLIFSSWDVTYQTPHTFFTVYRIKASVANPVPF